MLVADKVLLVDQLETPLGTLVIACQDGFLHGLEFKDSKMGLQVKWPVEVESVNDPFGFSSAIRAYFKGDKTVLDQIPVKLAGTEFQNKVWLALREIPFGETVTYGQLAVRVGSPKACRAVGITNGKNPIAIVLPCHRVIGANGTLTGYGGGLPRKEWLLGHENALGKSNLFSSNTKDGGM